MPSKPKRPCAFPGCPCLAAEGGRYCERHNTIQRKNYDRYNRFPDMNRKYGRAWKQIRERYAARNPLCERCLSEGRMTPVDEVHHIVPIKKGGTNSEDNLMSLCRSCHNKIHVEMGDR